MGENKIKYTLAFSQSLLSRADYILMLQILIIHVNCKLFTDLIL